MRGVYTAEIEISALAAAQTVVYVTAPANKVVEILSAHITQSDVDSNEQLEAGLYHITSLGTPTATAITPEKHEPGDQAAGSTAEGDVTASEPTYGAVAIDHKGFSNVGGYYFDPTPEERPIVPGGSSIGLRLLSAPAATNLIAQIVFRELG